MLGVRIMRFLLSCAAVVLAASASPVYAQTQGPLNGSPIGPSTSRRPLIGAYWPAPLPPASSENSRRLRELVQDGRLRLSLSDALTLAIENNLDVAVQRFVRPIAEADLLRTSSGQAARGVPGASVPSGLSAGALGVGVNAAGGTGGVGAAGGISGGGGAVSVPQVGTFDPAISINASFDRTASPLNSVVVAGVPQVTTASSASSINYTQLFAQGSSLTLTLNGIAQNSTQKALLYNPAVVSRLAVGMNQPLLNGFGLLPNQRFLMVARNNMKTSDELFRQQLTTTLVAVEDGYWNLSAARQAVAAAQRTYEAATTLVNDTKIRVDFGVAAGIDVVGVQSAAASAERDLIVARTNLQIQEAQLKTLLMRASDPDVDAAEIDTIDPAPQPGQNPPPDLQAMLATAMSHRPELMVAAEDRQNQDISVRFTRNGLLPSVSVFGLYAGAGLEGDTLQSATGVGASLGQAFDATYPEYAAGVSAGIPIRNRSAQADSMRARLEAEQQAVTLQRLKQQIELEVRQAVISVQQGQVQVEAAHEALVLAQRSAAAEHEKLDVGVSTAYDVLLRDRDLVAAQQADLTAEAAYARALVDLDRATGTIVEHNGIVLNDAELGRVAKAPSPDILQSHQDTTR
jgi:outer membrane protein TolC